MYHIDLQAQRVYAEEISDSLSPSSEGSAASGSEEDSKTPSDASNFSEDEEEDTIKNTGGMHDTGNSNQGIVGFKINSKNEYFQSQLRVCH